MTPQTPQGAALSDADIDDLETYRGAGMISAVGEYTPEEFWQLLDEVKQRRAADRRLTAEQGGALENCRLFAARHRKEEWAATILRFCAEGGATSSPLRSVTQDNPSDGIELAARWVEKRLADYDSEHGCTDPSTGTREYPGRGAGDEYVGELNEIIEGIRALAIPRAALTTQPQAEPADTKRLNWLESNHIAIECGLEGEWRTVRYRRYGNPIRSAEHVFLRDAIDEALATPTTPTEAT